MNQKHEHDREPFGPDFMRQLTEMWRARGATTKCDFFQRQEILRHVAVLPCLDAVPLETLQRVRRAMERREDHARRVESAAAQAFSMLDRGRASWPICQPIYERDAPLSMFEEAYTVEARRRYGDDFEVVASGHLYGWPQMVLRRRPGCPASSSSTTMEE